MLLGRVDGARSSDVLQQSNAIFAKLRSSGQVTGPQVVEALQRLAVAARGAPAADLEALADHPGLRQLLKDLVQQLPRDAGEQVEWDRTWTSQVVGALRDLPLPDAAADPRLFVRLGHALVQASPVLELENLLHAVCDLCALDRSGFAPDDYTLWVLGQRLEELCAGHAPGDLDFAKLVQLLHLFAHPSIRGRTAGRESSVVLRHVHHGLGTSRCSPSEIATILQAYSDVPNLVRDALGALEKGGERSFDALQLPEVAAVASALPPPLLRPGGAAAPDAAGAVQAAAGPVVAAAVAPHILRRLRVLAVPKEGSSAAAAEAPAPPADVPNLELLVIAAGKAAEQLTLADEQEAWQALWDILAAVGTQTPALQEAPVDTLAELLLLELSCTAALKKEGDDAAAASARIRAAAEALAPHAGELPTARIVGLAAALATARVDLQVLFEALRTAAESRAAAFSVDEFCSLARSFASAGFLEGGLLEAMDVEAYLTRSPGLSALAALAWSLAASGAERPLAWRLLAAALEARRGPGRGGGAWELATLPVEEKGMLYEALCAQQAVMGARWPRDSAVAEICGDAKAAEAWADMRSSTPGSAKSDHIAALLKDLGYAFKRDVVSKDGLYTMPFLLEDHNIVLDLLSTPPRHPASRRTLGSLMIRHTVWSSGGRSILAVPDSMWDQLALKAETSALDESAKANAGRLAQQNYLQHKVEGIQRRDLFKAADLREDTIRQLHGIHVGHGGLNLDALQKLQEQPAVVRESSVEKFRRSMLDNVRDYSAWMIGIIKKEQESHAKEQEKLKFERQQKVRADDGKSQEAAASRPAGGWVHRDARPVEDAKPREKVSGKVTNVWHGRVWVDAGFAKDVTFKAAPGLYKVGERLRNLQVMGYNIEQKCVEVYAPKPDLRRRMRQQSAPPEEAPATQARGARRPAAPKRGQEDRAEKRRAPSTTQRGPPPKAGVPPTDAAKDRPEGGWSHKGARPLKDFKVGEVVSGTVTNVLHDRVWIDVGAERDASFWKPGHDYKVGDSVKDVSISSINLEKSHLLVRAPNAEA